MATPPNKATPEDIQNSEKLLDLSNQLIDSINERRKLLKGIKAEEISYFATVKQQQKLSQDIAANAEKYLGYQIKSKDLDKQIETAKSNANKTNYAFSQIERKLLDQRKGASLSALNISKQIIKQKQEINKLDELNQSLQIQKNEAQRRGDTGLANQFQSEIRENQRIANTREKTVENLTKQYSKQKSIAKAAEETVYNGRKALKSQQEELAFLNRNLYIRKQIEKSTGLLGGLAKAASKIPGIGQYLNADEAIDEMEKLAAKIEESGQSATSFSNRLQIGLKGLSVLGKGLIDNLKSPEAVFTFIITQALKANTQSVQLGKSLGFGADKANEFRENLADIARSSTNVNVTAESLVESFNQLSETTGFVANYSADTLETQVMLTKQLGLSGEEAAHIYEMSVLTGKSSSQVNDEMLGAFVNTRNAAKVGVSMKQVFAEASKVSGQLQANFAGNPAKITAAIVKAKALGTTLEQTKNQGAKLLDFASSLESELKAELLTGKQLNLERARAAALAGDQVSLAEELNKNIGTYEDFSKMNVLQQEALAEAVGLTADQLAEQLKKQELAKKSGKSLAEITKQEAAEAEKRQAIQDKFNAAILKLQDFFGNLIAGPVGQLLEALTDMIGAAMKILSVFTPIFNIISGVAKVVSNLLSHWYILYPLVGLVALSYLPKMAAGFSSILGSVGNIGKGIQSAFSGNGIKGFFSTLKQGFNPKTITSTVQGATQNAAGNATQNANTVNNTATNIGKGGGGKSFKAKMKDIAAGLKEFADVKVLLGALNLIPSSLGLTAMIPGAIGAKILDTVDGKKVKEALKGIASGLVEFGKKNILLGSLNLVVASAGLTAMIPGAIGAKILSSIDGKKLKESLKAISSGIESFGKANLVLGAVNMLVAAIGLTAMIPGAIGAKIITQIDGKKFQKAMDGIAIGIQSFAKKDILLGAGAMVIAAVGLTAMIPGAIGAKMITQVDSKKFQKSMEGLAAGIQSFGKGNIALGSLNLVLAAVGLTAMIPGAIGAKMIIQVDSKKFQKSMEGIAIGIEFFSKGNIALGALNLALAAIGLTAMVPGVIAAKIIETVNSKKLIDNLKAIADGISEMGKGKTLLGALALPLISAGLVTMIPGVIGAKILEQINGKKLKESLSGLAAGISEMGSGKAVIGALVLPLISIGLIAMIPGVLGAKLIEQINGKKLKESLSGLAAGISEMGSAKVLLGAISLIPASIGLIAMIPGTIGALMMQAIDGKQLKQALSGLASGLESMASPKVLLGSLGLVAASVGLIAMIPGVVGGLLLGASAGFIAAGLEVLGGGLEAFGAIAATGIPFLGIGLLAAFGAALIPFGYALNVATPAIEAFGNVITKVFSGVATVITAAAAGISTIFTSLENVDVSKLLAIGPALIGVGVGLAALGGGGVLAAIGSFLGGDPIKKIERLAKAGDGLMKTSTALQGVASALTQLSTSLGSLDISKLEKIIEMSSSGGVTGFLNNMFDKITSVVGIKESPSVTPPVTPSVTPTPISSPASSAIATATNQTSIQPNIDLTPMINAINATTAAVNKLYAKDSSIHMDGKKVGTTLSQGSYKVA